LADQPVGAASAAMDIRYFPPRSIADGLAPVS
jgi:hypothetical protein